MSSKKTNFIIEDLISKIYQQNFWNRKLPTQRDLAAEYGVSRFTVQKALKHLESIGLIQSIQGDGIYVRSRALGNPMVYNSLTEVPYTEISSQVLHLEKAVPDSSVVQIFNLGPGEMVWEFQRIRIVRFEISQLETGYIPCRLFPDLTKKDLEDSIQNCALQKKYRISHFMTTYHAALLSKKEAEILRCKKGEPAMAIVSRGILKDGTIFVHSRITAIKYECTYITPFNKDVFLSRRKNGK